MVKKKKEKPKAHTIITSPATTIVVDGVAYTTGDTVPGEFPNFGKVVTDGEQDHQDELQTV